MEVVPPCAALTPAGEWTTPWPVAEHATSADIARCRRRGELMSAVMGAEGVAATQGLDWREEPGEPPPPSSSSIWLLEVLVSVEPGVDPFTPLEPGE